MQIISSKAKKLETQIPTSKAHFRLEYFPHSEWDEEAGGFVPTDPLTHPMILGKITVLIESMIAWKINHGEHPAGTLAQISSAGPSVETYLGYQASLADSGAQISSLSPDVCEKLGLEPEDYLPTEMEISGASGSPLPIQGVILARVQVGRMTTNQAMYVIDNPIGPVLSKKALIDLGIIPKDFPYQRQVRELRRPFVDSTGEAAAAKVTTEWNEMAAKVITEWDEMEAKMLQTSVQPLSSFETQRWEDSTDSCERDPASVRLVTSGKE